MAINPTTGLEDPNYKQTMPTPSPVGSSPVQKDAFDTTQVTTGGGPKINLDVMNEYRQAKGMPTLEHTTTPQASIDTVSNVSGGLSNLKIAPVTPVAGIVPPKETKIETPPLGGVKTPEVTGAIPQGIPEIVDQMFPKGQYSDEERKQMGIALASKSPQEQADFMAKNAQEKYAESQKLLEAYRTTRDFGLQQARTKALSDQRLADMTQQYDNAITQQKQKMEADANNMSVVQGTSGRLQSRNLQNAVTQVLDINKNIYSQLVSNKDRDIQRLADDLKYAQTVASNEYNDRISDEMQNMLKSIQALDKTGSLATTQGLVQARSFIDSTISQNMQHQADYFSKLSYISQRFDQYHKEALEQAKVDDSVTKTMGDGYLYNAQGMRVKGEDGNPIKVVDSSGILLTKEPITLSDGTKAFVYQNPDMTTRVEKIQGTGVAPIEPTVIAKYAQALATGMIGIDDLQKLGVPVETINQIIAQTSGKAPEAITPYQQAQIELEREKMKAGQQMTPYQKAQIEIEKQKLGKGDWTETSTPGVYVDKNTGTTKNVVAEQAGADLMKALASGKADGKKFFGVYATGDPTGQNRANAYSAIAKTGISADLAKFPNTKITEEMINNASARSGIDPIMIATILKLDSSYGTQGLGSRNNNPGNVGQFDSLGTKGVKGYPTLQDGVNAVADNLKKRMNAMQSIVGTKIEDKKGYTPSLSSLYLKGTDVAETTLKRMGKTQEQFLSEAHNYIKDYAEQRYGKLGFTLQDPELYSSIIASPQGKNLEKEMPAKISALNSMNDKFGKLIKMTREQGPEAFSIFGSEHKDMAQLYGEILMEAKEALNLGVLQKIDEDTIRRQIPDPSSWGESLTTGITQGSREAIVKRLETARDSLNLKGNQDLESIGIVRGGTTPTQGVKSGTNAPQQIKTTTGKTFSKEELLNALK